MRESHGPERRSMKHTLLASALTLSYCLAWTNAQGAQSTKNIPSALQAIGHSPEWVQSRFGKPDHVLSNRCCSFSGYNSDPVIAQSYELKEGGFLGFVYARPLGSDNWIDVGVVYDALQSIQQATVRSIFQNDDLRQRRVFQCYDKDFMHWREGMPQTDGWNYVPVAFAGWAAEDSRLVYIQYLVGQHPPTKYDAISGSNVLTTMSTQQLDHLPVVQFGYFQSPRTIEDLHFVPSLNDDFSIIVAQKKCFGNVSVAAPVSIPIRGSTVAPPSAQNTAPAPRSTGPGLVICSGTPVIRPTTMHWCSSACSSYMAGIVWKSWAIDGATGVGTLMTNDGVPNCGQGTWTKHPGSIVILGNARVVKYCAFVNYANGSHRDATALLFTASNLYPVPLPASSC